MVNWKKFKEKLNDQVFSGYNEDEILDLVEQGEDNQALLLVNQNLKKHPKNLNALLDKADLLYELERYGEAFQVYDKALKIDPNLDETWFNIGCVLEDLERYEEAGKAYDRALKIDPEDIGSTINKAHSLSHTNQNMEALPLIKKALKMNDEDTVALEVYCEILSNLNEHEKALEVLERLIKNDPDNPGHWTEEPQHGHFVFLCCVLMTEAISFSPL